jgi:hypothetical protein
MGVDWGEQFHVPGLTLYSCVYSSSLSLHCGGHLVTECGVTVDQPSVSFRCAFRQEMVLPNAHAQEELTCSHDGAHMRLCTCSLLG